MPWGNPAVGVRNAVAPPMRVQVADDGSRWSEVQLRAWADHISGPKKVVRGTLCADDVVCVEADAVFVIPRWARSTEPTAI